MPWLKETTLNAVASDTPDAIVSASLKLDIGCGKNKRPGFAGVDAIDFPGVDHVLDVRKTPWPFVADSVQEVYCSHFVEHLTGAERVGFFNELYRVMAWEATARVIVPSWTNDCAYGDPTHQWPPVSGWMVFYLEKSWRDRNAPHVGYTCDFDGRTATSSEQWLNTQNQDVKTFAVQHYVNSASELIFTLVKRKRT